MAKCFASDSAMRITTDAVQVLGGYGYVREYPVERSDAGREDHADLRGHEPDPARGHRPRAPEGDRVAGRRILRPRARRRPRRGRAPAPSSARRTAGQASSPPGARPRRAARPPSWIAASGRYTRKDAPPLRVPPPSTARRGSPPAWRATRAPARRSRAARLRLPVLGGLGHRLTEPRRDLGAGIVHADDDPLVLGDDPHPHGVSGHRPAAGVREERLHHLLGERRIHLDRDVVGLDVHVTVGQVRRLLDDPADERLQVGAAQVGRTCPRRSGRCRASPRPAGRACERAC